MTEDAKAEALRLAKEARKPCEYCGADLPTVSDKRSRQIRGAHFQSCAMRLAQAAEAEAISALARAPQAGGVLVPREPTLKMLEAAIDCTHDANTDTWENYWQAMLAAAPSPITYKDTP